MSNNHKTITYVKITCFYSYSFPSLKTGKNNIFEKSMVVLNFSDFIEKY